MASHKTPPQPPPSFAVAPAQLLAETESLIGITQALEDRLAESLTPATARFDSVLLPLLRDDHAAARSLCVFRIFTSVAAGPDLRDAARKAEQMTARAGAASLMRRDVAGLVASVYEKHRSGSISLDDESAYKLFKTHRAYQNAGAGIADDARRADYLAAVEERNAVLVAAKKTLSETDDGVWFTRTQLAGVPPSKLDTMEASDDGDSLKVTFKRGHLQPVMKHATSARTRKALHVARENRFPENVEALERAVTLRDTIARMLGFPNHAELRIEAKMAPSVESVVKRLHKLRDELQPLARDEMDVLHELKKAYIKENGSAVDEDEDDMATLNSWDWAFYARILEQQRYSVDSQRVSEYFEVRHSLDGMLRIFEELFGIVFVPTDAPTWHDDVTVFAAWDSEQQGGGFLGYLYLDVYARDGKYAGAHSSLVQPGFTNEDNTRHYPSSSLVCSLVRSSTPGKPTLLQHSELKTMFHELGHAIHKLVTRTAYSHGCARDFVEIPSILLENWIWVPSVLQRLGRHYRYLGVEKPSDSRDEPPEMLPQDLAESIAKTKHVGAAHAMLHQVFLALFDLTIHSAASPEAAHATDTTALWNATKADVVGLRTTTGIGQASFAHPFRAYDASYFTYALSKVYATDLWVSCFKDNPMDPEVGLRYRRCVLEPGGGQPEALSLKAFLGRDPSDEAYYSEVSGTK
ncbi:hypothetical protein B0J13DRAFT_589447 [Dactylonectria estremocensis]|uniref:Peptidase M3A/M3B catalytic domain-containing protein n=1 Tax=Dactylonectria estremocensis TaxID=1079267 RepID=A0A9P9DMZ1_9HYPO|nr:hypothetical protein B0J13DRAFT_589447 [Dactylonectria estremocensis]